MLDIMICTQRYATVIGESSFNDLSEFPASADMADICVALTKSSEQSDKSVRNRC